MPSEHTPHLAHLREVYIASRRVNGTPEEFVVHAAEFDRAIAAHDEQVRAAAWDEGAAAEAKALEAWFEPDSTERMYWPDPTNPYKPTPAEQKAHPEDGHERGETFATAPEWCWVCHPENDPSAEQKESICGDYPAPCNCDDPITHGGH